MPELPEVETTRLGLLPHVLGQQITAVCIRQKQLRFALADDFDHLLMTQYILGVTRRAKYLILELSQGFLMIHLGMSGHLRIFNLDVPPAKHDHIDIVLSNQQLIRYRDPRRFGFMRFNATLDKFTMLQHLGPEPFECTALVFYNQCQKRQAAIKICMMNQSIIVGIGNIYASEALFLAKIHPLTPAKKLSLAECEHLLLQIQQVLHHAISQGGTTLQDYVSSAGTPGYFKQELRVYQREHQFCYDCNTAIKKLIIGQRSSFFCPHCQISRD
jgi:formamidopyrimidine-DNA glycosylase